MNLFALLRHATVRRAVVMLSQPSCSYRMASVGRGPGAGFALSALLLLSGHSLTAAETLPGADLASIHAWLYQHNAQLQALQADAEAAEARIYPAGALPDPMGSMELDDIDKNRPTLLPSVVPMAGAARNDQRWMAVAPVAAGSLLALVAISFLILVNAFVQQDFSVAYVAANSNLKLPIQSRISAVWGAHEG
ncbi:MAG: hypothetical protein COS34_13480, partial [Lysobacterales bacterium CG02_land_8_20_14_3_00_62_12]